jgi:hypothetical protein
VKPAQEGFLHDIVGILFVFGHTARQQEDGVTIAFDEHLKGLSVACAHLLDHGGIAVFQHPIQTVNRQNG